LLSTYGERFGLDREMAFKVAGVFGSGMGRGDTCGAVTGAFMVIGLKHGKTKGSDDASQERTDELARQFAERFIARNSSIVCRELLGCDISTSEGLKAAKKEKHFKKRCPKFVQDAAEILEEMLKNQ
jgi:C_GCAxxG_C_C family probable redox protein